MCVLCQQLGIDLHKLDAGGFDGAADGASASWAALPGNPGADAESSGSDTVPGSTGTSSTLSGGTSARGFINAMGDQDWYAVTLTAGQTYTFALSGFGVGALSDAYLRLLDASGVQVAFDDDSGPLANSKITFTASASGNYFISAQGYGGTTTGQYLLTMATGTTPYTPAVTVSDVADYLTNTYWESNNSVAHHWAVSTISYNVQGLSPERAALARVAFQLWSEVANLTFVETSGTALMTLDDTQAGAFTSASYGGNGIVTSATINVDPTWYGSSSAIDSYTLQTFIHEIGHALGLGHGGPYNGSATYGVDNIYANDTWQYTIMSYMAESNFGGATYRFTMTPMMADILAIQNSLRHDNHARGRHGLWLWLDRRLDVRFLHLWAGAGADHLRFRRHRYAQCVRLQPEPGHQPGRRQLLQYRRTRRQRRHLHNLGDRERHRRLGRGHDHGQQRCERAHRRGRERHPGWPRRRRHSYWRHRQRLHGGRDRQRHLLRRQPERCRHREQRRGDRYGLCVDQRLYARRERRDWQGRAHERRYAHRQCAGQHPLWQQRQRHARWWRRHRHGGLFGAGLQLPARPQRQRHLDHYGSSHRQPGWYRHSHEYRADPVQRHPVVAEYGALGPDHQLIFER